MHHRHDHDDLPGPRDLVDHLHAARARRGGGRWAGGGGRGGWGAGRRMPRGAIRGAILLSLVDGPAHGYEVMRRLEDMSGGLWRPSPGSVYPHLQMLEDQGLVLSSESEGSRVYELTESGRAEAAQAASPWNESGETDETVRELRHGVGQLMSAAKQLAGAGEAAQIERGLEVIRRARKELYQILGED
jgi:DNA-binding PadR family transcriptional regulator